MLKRIEEYAYAGLCLFLWIVYWSIPPLALLVAALSVFF